MVDLLETILVSPLSNDVTKEYVLTALVKLSTRFSSGQEYVTFQPNGRLELQ